MSSPPSEERGRGQRYEALKVGFVLGESVFSVNCFSHDPSPPYQGHSDSICAWRETLSPFTTQICPFLFVPGADVCPRCGHGGAQRTDHVSVFTATRARPYYASPNWDVCVIEFSGQRACAIFPANIYSSGLRRCIFLIALLVLFRLLPLQHSRRCIPHRPGTRPFPRHRFLQKSKPGVFTSRIRRHLRNLQNRMKNLSHLRPAPELSACPRSPPPSPTRFP